MQINTSTGCINKVDFLIDIGTEPQSGMVSPALPGDHPHVAGWNARAAIGSGPLSYVYAFIEMLYISKINANEL